MALDEPTAQVSREYRDHPPDRVRLARHHVRHVTAACLGVRPTVVRRVAGLQTTQVHAGLICIVFL